MTTPSISVLSNLRLGGAMVFGNDAADFPANPQIGTMILKGSSLYAYIMVAGMATWFPLVRSLNQSYIHTQGMAMTEWTVTHNFNSTQLWYQIQDTQGNIITASAFEQVDSNSFKLRFSEPQDGTVVCIGNAAIDVPSIQASLIELGSDVVINTSGLYIKGFPVLTQAILFDLVNTQILETTYTKAQVMQMIADAIAANNAAGYAS